MRKITCQELKSPILFLATGMGSGLSPIAPGTAGSLAALPFFWFLSTLPPLYYTTFLVTVFIFGIWLCDRATKILGVHDHKSIVFDEWVGMWLSLFFSQWNLLDVTVAFIAFRFFDIVKPWPISWVDRKIHGGLGIMLDDILAGFLALITGYFLKIIF